MRDPGWNYCGHNSMFSRKTVDDGQRSFDTHLAAALLLAAKMKVRFGLVT